MGKIETVNSFKISSHFIEELARVLLILLFVTFGILLGGVIQHNIGGILRWVGVGLSVLMVLVFTFIDDC